MPRLNTHRSCRNGGKHAVITTATTYNLNTIKCAKCGDSMPTYATEKTVKQRLGDKKYTCNCGHTGICVESLYPEVPVNKPIFVVRCQSCKCLIEEKEFA